MKCETVRENGDPVQPHLLAAGGEIRLLLPVPSRWPSVPISASDAEYILTSRVRDARTLFEKAAAEVLALELQAKGGAVFPDEIPRRRLAFDGQSRARVALARALEQLNDFLLYGIQSDERPPDADRSRERALEAALFGLYQAWSRLPIPANRLRPFFAEKFRQMIVPGCKLYKHGPAAVRHVLFRGKTGVLAHLAENNRLDLSVEALVLSGEWDDLFNSRDRQRASEKLEQYARRSMTAGA